MMNLASIDIGSNGARLLIKRFDPEAIREEDRIKKLMFIRIPLRLGKDVFTLGKVSKEREKMMLHMMKGFKQFMKLNDVEAFRACATSAMRDAENGKKVLTPMFIVILALGTTDLLFALDSIPAIFGLTQDPFLVLMANIFALMGLRQLYFLIGGLLQRLVYLSVGLSFILAFIGVKLVLHALHEYHLDLSPIPL